MPCLRMPQAPSTPKDIQDAFDALPDSVRPILLRLRALIFEMAATMPDAPVVQETIKWGQPSYAVPKGTPMRLGMTNTGHPAIFVHCQSTLVSDMRLALEPALCFDGNRAVLIPPDAALPEQAVRHFIHAALTYRLSR